MMEEKSFDQMLLSNIESPCYLLDISFLPCILLIIAKWLTPKLGCSCCCLLLLLLLLLFFCFFFVVALAVRGKQQSTPPAVRARRRHIPLTLYLIAVSYLLPCLLLHTCTIPLPSSCTLSCTILHFVFQTC